MKPEKKVVSLALKSKFILNFFIEQYIIFERKNCYESKADHDIRFYMNKIDTRVTNCVLVTCLAKLFVQYG